MTSRLILRTMLGLPLSESDLDDLIDAAPELLEGDERVPGAPWLAVLPPVLAVVVERQLHPRHLQILSEELGAYWREVLRAARARASARAGSEPMPKSRSVLSSMQCTYERCPLKPQPGPDEGPEHHSTHQAPSVTEFLQISAKGGTPRGAFMNMAQRVSSRLKKPIKRVIITDPYIHCDDAEDGTPGGHMALLEFLESIGVDAKSNFALELTPSPKRGTDSCPLKDTILGKHILKKFPGADLKNHKQCGTFHDRLYLAVDSTGRWDGLYGPSINGLVSLAMVLIGDFEDEGLAKDHLKRLLD